MIHVAPSAAQECAIKKCVNMTRREISKGSEYRRFNTKLVNLQGCKSVQLGSHESL